METEDAKSVPDLNQHQRLNAMLEMISDRGRISVHEAVEQFGVSGATIRRDLEHLAEQQLIRRTRGGAVALLSYDLPLGYKVTRDLDTRQLIGQRAAEHVSAGHVIGLTGGAAAMEVARALAARPDFAERPDVITVVTNAINVSYELAIRPAVKLILTGGATRGSSYQLTGSLALHSLDRLSTDLLFLAPDAISLSGVSVRDEEEAAVQRRMVEQARAVIVVAESAKVGARAFAQVCDLSQVDTLVTDAQDEDYLHQLGVKIIRAR